MYNRRKFTPEEETSYYEEKDRWTAGAVFARAFVSFLFGAAFSFLIFLFFIFDLGLDKTLLMVLAGITLIWTILGIFYCEKMLSIGQKVIEDIINIMGSNRY